MSGMPLASVEDVKEAAQYRAYEKERQAKRQRVPVETAAVAKLLQLVVEGEQAQAETLLQHSPYLALQKGTVVDLSQREFKGITGFQYALWALDWHMWRMLLKYLPKQKAAEQVQELENKGIFYRIRGKDKKEKTITEKLGTCPWEGLIQALKVLAQNVKVWSADQINTYWHEVVGWQQRLLPVHVVNEYCNPSRSFDPCPEFKEAHLIRTRVTANGGDWFSCILLKSVGEGTFAWQRGKERAVRARAYPVRAVDLPYYPVHTLTANLFLNFVYTGLHTGDALYETVVMEERACRGLLIRRQLQLANLKFELERLWAVSERLKHYLPSALIPPILDYFADGNQSIIENSMG